MTANELADELEGMGYLDWLSDAATMLRQQQLRIDQLLETQDYLYKKHDEQQAELNALKNAKDYWCLAYKDVFNKLEFQTLSKNERPFICGLSGDKGSDNMNEYILVCPADGADGFAVYKKHKDYSAPGY
jgi:hypothetical protein